MALRMALRPAVNDGLLARNVAALVRLPAVARPDLRILTVDEYGALRAVDSPYANLWALLAGTGLRLGEALALRWSDVDLAAATLTVRHTLPAAPRRVRQGERGESPAEARLRLTEPKTAAGRRTVGLPSVVVAAMRAQEALPTSITGFVFTSTAGTPLDQRNVSRAFARDLASAGIPRMRIHDLRHTAASFMIGQGLPLDDVKRVLGHSSITMTSDTYGHLLPGRTRAIAEALDRMLG
jgi:integrase